MIVTKLLLFSSLFCVILGSSWNNFEDFLRYLSRREKNEANSNKKSNKLKFHQYLTEEQNIKENDQLNYHVKYFFRRPTKNIKHIDESDSSDLRSYDSCEEIARQNIKSLSNNCNKQSSQIYHDIKSISHKNGKQNNRSSKSFDDEIFNFHKKDSRKNKLTLQSRKNTIFYSIGDHGSNEIKSVEESGSNDSKTNTNSDNNSNIIAISNYEVIKHNSKKNPQFMINKKASTNQNVIAEYCDLISSKQLIESAKAENIKIQHSMIESNKLVKIKRSISVKNENEVDIQRLIRESIFIRWQELEITVKLLLIDNYRFTRTTLLQEIVSNNTYKIRDISRLEKKLLQLYYTLKRDVLQIVKLTKIQFRRKVSKQRLKIRQMYEVQQLYITKLKEQINTIIIIFKQNVVLIIEQFYLELRPLTDYTTTEATTTIEPSTEVPFDPVYESITVTNYTPLIKSTTIISAIGHVALEDIPLSTSTLTEIDNTDEKKSPTLTSAHRYPTEVVTTYYDH